MEASTAILRPWREERGTSRRESGASSERSLARPLIPMVTCTDDLFFMILVSMFDFVIERT